ncbi:MAG: FAD-dependent oxidoreductase, partial [Pseudomonadota bacterium]
FTHLETLGLSVKTTPEKQILTSPEEFAKLFPATGGALYGRANHSWNASFHRPDNRTRIRGLYLAGGSVHPGPGVPMAAMSGRLAAARILDDLNIAARARVSIKPSRRVATFGGT